jgi:hypothetical protein
MHEAHAFGHGLLRSLTKALRAKVIGNLPFGCYVVFLSNCGGASTMEPPVFE